MFAAKRGCPSIHRPVGRALGNNKDSQTFWKTQTLLAPVMQPSRMAARCGHICRLQNAAMGGISTTNRPSDAAALRQATSRASRLAGVCRQQRLPAVQCTGSGGGSRNVDGSRTGTRKLSAALPACHANTGAAALTARRRGHAPPTAATGKAAAEAQVAAELPGSREQSVSCTELSNV